MNETVTLIICFLIGALIGGVILFFSAKGARKSFSETIKSNDEEWEGKENEEKEIENEK